MGLLRSALETEDEPINFFILQGSGKWRKRRLAEYLERSQAGRVEDVRIRITATTVTLELVAPPEPSVEIWEARKHAPLFVQAFERELVLTHRPHAHSPFLAAVT